MPHLNSAAVASPTDTGPAGITLRPVTDEDTEFLFALYASTRAEELAVTGWSDEQKLAFLRMQFAAQTTDYERRFSQTASFDVVELDGVPIGRLYVERNPGEIHIVDVALLPRHRGRGIGAALIRGLQAECRESHRRLSIYVETFNRAQSLYRRLGFVPVRDEGVYLYMEWADR